MKPDSTHTCQQLEAAARGNSAAFQELFARYRPELVAAVALRMEPPLRRRVDPSDVVQESQLDAFRRLTDFLERRPMPFRLWLRKTTYERLIKIRQHHLQAERRAARREARLPDETSLDLARQLISPQPSPSQVASRRELLQIVQATLADLDDGDREILLMRYLEKLSNVEIAQVLDLKPPAVSKRLGRALLRLQTLFQNRGLDLNQDGP